MKKKIENISLYNENDIVHKLSHQHLYTKFWIVQLQNLPKNAIEIKKIKSFAVPMLINNFLNGFNFS